MHQSEEVAAVVAASFLRATQVVQTWELRHVCMIQTGLVMWLHTNFFSPVATVARVVLFELPLIGGCILMYQKSYSDMVHQVHLLSANPRTTLRVSGFRPTLRYAASASVCLGKQRPLCAVPVVLTPLCLTVCQYHQRPSQLPNG